MDFRNWIAPLLNLPAAIYAVAYAAGVCAFIGMARRRRLSTPGVYTMLCVGLIGGLIGANAAQWIFGGTDGKSIIGGIAVGYAAVWFWKKRIGLRRPLGDLFAVAMCVGEAIGRWGCYFGGCCYGRASHGAWVVWQHGAWRYPTQIYSSLAAAAILVVLLLYDRRKPPENALFYLQGALYCTARFVIEFFRESPIVFAHLTTAQIACAAGFCFFSTAYLRLTTGARRERQQRAALPELS